MKDYLKLYKQKREDQEDYCPLATAILGKQAQCGKNCPFEKCLYDTIEQNNEELLATIYEAIEKVKERYEH